MSDLIPIPVFLQNACENPATLSTAVGAAAGSEDCNAHYVDDYSQHKRFVVAEGPNDVTAHRFWQMVWEQDCGCIVMLTPCDAPVPRGGVGGGDIVIRSLSYAVSPLLAHVWARFQGTVWECGCGTGE